VQTPLTGHPAALLAIGDLVWFRHAKSGEVFEHATTVRLLAGDELVDSVPTYRGCGQAF
jgi:D-serine deaminase-like pyridoxal phosphate-dependent protein